MYSTRWGSIPLTLLLAGSLSVAACGNDDDDDAAAEPAATVEMSEYSFKVTGEMAAGATLRLHNAGKEFHMIGLGRLKPGKTLDDAQKALETESEADDEETLDQVGMPGSIFGPGQQADITVPAFGAGNYVMVCFINVAGEETPHFAKGMIGELDVVESEGEESEPEAEADATYVATKGKAVTGPTELKAGYRVLEVTATGADASELEPGLVKIDDGKTLQEYATAIKVFDEGPLKKDAAESLPGEFITGVFDFGEANTVSIGVDLEPGTYVLVADDSDDDDDPDIPVEHIEITVK
jgi:hypothetical protein